MTASIRARTSGKLVVQAGKNRRPLRILIRLLPGVLLAALIASGCGKSEPEPAAPPETSEQPAAEESATPEAPKPAKPPAESSAAAPAALPEEPPEEKTPRPESVVDWKPADYYGAKQDRDPRLVDAVAFLAERGAGDVQAAKLLAELLTTVEAPEPDPAPQPEAEPPKPKQSDSDEEGYSDEEYSEEEYSESEESMSEEEYSGDEEYDSEESESPQRRSAVAARADVELLKPAYVSLVGAIVRALGTNGTEPSRKILEQLLAGTIRTGNDRLAASAALKALVDARCPENEAILLKALTQSESLRPEGRGEVTAEQLRETTLDLVLKSAMPPMRMELAKYLFSPNPSVDLRERLVSFIMASHPYNLTPQTAIYQRPQTSPQVKRDFAVFFTTYSSSALARLLGVSVPPPSQEAAALDLAVAQAESGQAEKPWVAFGDNATAPKPEAAEMRDDYSDEEESRDTEESMEESSSSEEYYEEGEEGRPGVKKPRDLGNWAAGSGRKPDTVSIEAFAEAIQSDPDLPQYVAGQLWSPKFSATVATALESVASLESDTQVVNLATTIPTDVARAALYKTLQAHWQEGPQGLLAAAALPGEGTIDPAFLALVKSVPREMPEKAPTGTRAPARPADTAADRNKPSSDWFWSSQTLLRYLCDGFQKTAPAQSGAEAASEAMADLPFKIHEDANIVTAYRIDWQQAVGDKLPGAQVDPLVVHYFHIQDSTRYSRMLGFYRRAVAGAEVHELDSGAWIDSYRAGSDPSRKRSVDVLITRLPENTDPRSTADESLEVEILAIEFNNPEPQ